MGNEYGDEFKLWPGRFEPPDEVDEHCLCNGGRGARDEKESNEQLFKRLGLTALVNQARAKML